MYMFIIIIFILIILKGCITCYNHEWSLKPLQMNITSEMYLGKNL